MNHLFAHIATSGWVFNYAWQDDQLFRVNLRKDLDKGFLLCGGTAYDFETALEEAVDAMDKAEFVPDEPKTIPWSIDTRPEASLIQRLGLNAAPITRRF